MAVPRTSLVFDVNVLVDAVNPSSRVHRDAVTALANETEVPAFISRTMLRTTANKLIELGGDPRVVQEYIELLIQPDEDGGLGIELLTDVLERDYDIRDRYGRPDAEDSTVVSLMDAAEKITLQPSVLISNDKTLSDWCADHNRVAMVPGQLPWRYGQHPEQLRLASLQYLARRVLKPAPSHIPELSASAQSRKLAAQIVAEATAPAALTGFAQDKHVFDTDLARLREVVGSWNPHSEIMKPRIETWRKNLTVFADRAEKIALQAESEPDEAQKSLSLLAGKLEEALSRLDPRRQAPRPSAAHLSTGDGDLVASGPEPSL